MRVVGQRIEHEIDMQRAAQVLRVRQPWRKDEALGVEPAQRRSPAQIGLRFGSGACQPKDAAGNLVQDPHPSVEHGRQDLEDIVEAGIDEGTFRQAAFGTGRYDAGDLAPAVVGLVGAGEPDDSLGEMREALTRGDDGLAST